MKVEVGQLRRWVGLEGKDGMGLSGCFLVIRHEGDFIASHGRTMVPYWSIFQDQKVLTGCSDDAIKFGSAAVDDEG